MTGTLPAADDAERQVVAFHYSVETDLDRSIRRFWEIEEIPSATALLSPEDELCENHFRQTHSCTADGRFVVRLKIRPDVQLQGDNNRAWCLKWPKGLERRLNRDEILLVKYIDFLREYEALAHMKRAPLPSNSVLS